MKRKSKRPATGPAPAGRAVTRVPKGPKVAKEPHALGDILIVDGYNVIHASQELMALEDLAHARDRLIAWLAEYQALTGCRTIIVFDGHLVKGNTGSTVSQNNVEVIFSSEGETADTVIEKLVTTLAERAKIAVATSDGAQQGFVFGKGAQRKPAREILKEINDYRQKTQTNQTKLFNDKNIGDLLDNEVRKILEDYRRQKY